MSIHTALNVIFFYIISISFISFSHITLAFVMKFQLLQNMKHLRKLGEGENNSFLLLYNYVN